MWTMRERLACVALAAAMLLRDMLRRRLTLVLLFVVPTLFDLVVLATTTKREVSVVLSVLPTDRATRVLDDRGLTLVFMGTAAVCFLTCFLAFHLVGKCRDVDARLVLAGFRPHELLLAKLALLLLVVATLGLYETAILRPLLDPATTGGLFAGLFCGGLVYGSLGFLVGTITVHELEGVFVIVLLTNVDVGWLQNPVYYATSPRRALIEALPGHYPAQLAIVSTLTNDTAWSAIAKSSAYAFALLLAALVVFALRNRPRGRA